VPQRAAALDVLFFFRPVLFGAAAVAGRQLQIAFGRNSCLQFPSALEFGVQFGTEEQGEIGDPQPQQEDDDACQRAVGLVVAAEMLT